MERPEADRAAWIVRRYEAVTQLSCEMLAAARQGRWDGLVELEQQRTTALGELMADAKQGPIPNEAADQVATSIGAILEADAEIASLAQAWQDELKSLLGSMGAERKISKAYGP